MSTPLAELAVGEFLDRLAARVPASGGGATAALHAAQATALVEMVGRYTTGKKYTEYADLVDRILRRAGAAREQALKLADDDVAAFTAVTEAYRLPRDTPDPEHRRSATIFRSLAAAATPPAEVIRVAQAVLGLAETLLPAANRNVITDVAAAAEAARAAAITARLNVEINLGGIRDEDVRSDLHRGLELVDPMVERAAVVERAVRDLLG